MKKEDPLETLPTHTVTPCVDCGSTTWKYCNYNETKTGLQFKQCSDCHYYDAETGTLKLKSEKLQ
jgi:hypothetical protein